MGNYISKVTPVRPVFGKKLDESNTIVGEEILETPNQSDLSQEQPNNSKDSLKVDNHDSPSPDNEEEDEQANGHQNGSQANGSHTNGFTNGQSNGQSNGHHSNGHSISDENGDQAEDEINEEDEQTDELNGKLSKTDLKNKKADKSYSSKKASLINEVDPVESQQDEEEIDNFEVVGRKRKGRKATTPKKQYKKRKNNLLSELEKVNELAVDE